MTAIRDLLSEHARRALAELAKQEDAKPPEVPAAKFKPPPGPGDGRTDD